MVSGCYHSIYLRIFVIKKLTCFPGCTTKTFTESAPLVSDVELVFSGPQCQLPTFCPLPVPSLRPFHISPQPLSNGFISESCEIRSKDVIGTFQSPVYQTEPTYTASSITPPKSVQSSPCESPNSSLFEITPNGCAQLPTQLPTQQSLRPTSRSTGLRLTDIVQSGPFMGGGKYTVVQHAQPTTPRHHEQNRTGDGESYSQHDKHLNIHTGSPMNEVIVQPTSLNELNGRRDLKHSDDFSIQSHSYSFGLPMNCPFDRHQNRVTRTYTPQNLQLLSESTPIICDRGESYKMDRFLRQRACSVPSTSQEFNQILSKSTAALSIRSESSRTSPNSTQSSPQPPTPSRHSSNQPVHQHLFNSPHNEVNEMVNNKVNARVNNEVNTKVNSEMSNESISLKPSSPPFDISSNNSPLQPPRSDSDSFKLPQMTQGEMSYDLTNTLKVLCNLNLPTDPAVTESEIPLFRQYHNYIAFSALAVFL